ncbi:MAG: cardiolipin synthase [Sulfurovum sp.]|nr:cardiolipin synthase [Sulfurovum sp.]
MTITHLLLSYFFIIVGGLLVFTAIGHILYQKRSPTSMISWMMAIIFLPFITVPLYFVIGIRKRTPKNKDKEYVEFHTPAQHNEYIVESSNHSILSILEKNAIPPATKANNFELITSSEAAFKQMLEEIHNATKSIDIGTYVFEFDKTTKVLIEALILKAQEGVRVRLLLDLVGSLSASFNQKGFKALKKAGGEVAFFVPVLKRPFQNYINLRNHRKIYLFDQKRVLSGGMNLSNDYMGEADGSKRWNDLMYLLEGPAVHDFYSIFHNDWSYATTADEKPELIAEHKEHKGEYLVQVVPSGPDIPTDALYETLLNSIYTAEERIWIVTPYFVPDENMVQALVIAKHKGVDVKLITPKESDNLLTDIARSSYMRELEKVGVDVVLYEGEMLHAKAILFDSLGGMVGSVNLDNRSLFLNYEVVTFVYNKAFIVSLSSWMNGLMENSTRGLDKPSKFREAVENIMKVFAPLL